MTSTHSIDYCKVSEVSWITLCRIIFNLHIFRPLTLLNQFALSKICPKYYMKGANITFLYAVFLPEFYQQDFFYEPWRNWLIWTIIIFELFNLLASFTIHILNLGNKPNSINYGRLYYVHMKMSSFIWIFKCQNFLDTSMLVQCCSRAKGFLSMRVYKLTQFQIFQVIII